MFSKQEVSDLLKAIRHYLNWGDEVFAHQKIKRLKELEAKLVEGKSKMNPVGCVITKYLPPTNNTVARIGVTLGSGKRRYFPWDSELNIEENHQRGVRLALEEKFNTWPEIKLYSAAHASVGYVHFLMR